MSFPHAGMLRSWWTYVGLTLAPALAGHLAFDVADGGAMTLISRPIHAVYVLVVFAAFVASVLHLYAHQPAERRRRIALMHAGLRGRRAPLALSLVAQIALAALTLQAEGAVLDAPHLLLGILCGLVALVFGALALRRIEASVLHFARAAFASRRPNTAPLRALEDVRLRIAVASPNPYALFRPNRPPPAFA